MHLQIVVCKEEWKPPLHGSWVMTVAPVDTINGNTVRENRARWRTEAWALEPKVPRETPSLRLSTCVSLDRLWASLKKKIFTSQCAWPRKSYKYLLIRLMGQVIWVICAQHTVGTSQVVISPISNEQTCYRFKKKKHKGWGVTQLVECLSYMCAATCLSPSTIHTGMMKITTKLCAW